MTGGGARRLGAAALAVACLVVVVGQASAEEVAPTLSVNDATAVEGSAVPFVITLSEVAAANVTVTAKTSGGSGYTGRDETVTIPAGQKTAPFPVATAGNDLDQPDRQFTLTLSGQSGNATLGDATGTGAITDDDATPTLAISGPTSVDEVAGNAAYSVAITGKSAGTVTVNYAAANGTATVGQDYGAPTGTPSWPADSPSGSVRTILVPILPDALDEIDENFSVNLSSPVGATITAGTATTSITDNDAEPSIKQIVDISVTEGNTGTVDAVMTVELTAPSGRRITVPYTTVAGTATQAPPPVDFQTASGNLIFDPSQTSKTITVKVNGDTLAEPNETFSVAITDPDFAGPEPDNRGVITIVDDESTPIPTLANASVLEGNTGLTDLVFEATLNAPHPAVTFNYRTVADTANSTDFDPASGSRLFPANSGTTPTKLPITIKVKGDLLDEVDETLKLELLNPSNDAVVRTATGTIRNDDSNSKMSISDASAEEPGTMTFTVTLSAASAREVKVNWGTADGTATAGSDYTAGGGELTFAAGELTKTIGVAVLGDDTNEENETLKVNLSNPSGIPAANVLDGQGDGTIVDRNAPPSLSISDEIAREGAGATFTVTLAGTTLRTVTVSFNTIEATAKAGTDFSARTGTLSFAPGESSKSITITVLDDTASEPTEDFFVGIGDAVNATITKNRGLGAIEASDQAGVVEAPKPPDTTKPPVSLLVPRMILGPRTVTIGPNGVARMLVTCQRISPIGCAGTVELERSTKPLLKLGKKTFTVKKGGKGYASIKLSARTLAILRKSKTGTLRAKVIVIVKTNTKKTMRVSPGVITLKGTKAFLLAKPKPAAPPTQVVVDP